MGKILKEMASCIFSFESFCVYNILFLKPRTYSWRLLFIACLFLRLLLCCQVATQSLLESFWVSFLSFLFLFFPFLFTGSERFGFFTGYSLDDALDPDGHTQGKQHLGSLVWNSLGVLSCSTRLAAGCRSSR